MAIDWDHETADGLCFKVSNAGTVVIGSRKNGRLGRQAKSAGVEFYSLIIEIPTTDWARAVKAISSRLTAIDSND